MPHAHRPALEADGAVDILGVADPVRSAAEGLMDCWGDELPYYPDWRRLLREQALDASASTSMRLTRRPVR